MFYIPTLYNIMSEQYTLIISFSIALIIMLPIGYYYYNRIKKRKELTLRLRKELTDNLTIAIENNTITEIKDLIDFVNGFENLDKLYLNFPFEYYNLLATAKYNISIRKYINFGQENLLYKTNELLKEVDTLIKDYNKKEPFYNVPTSERNLLIDILDFSGLQENNVFYEKLNKLGDLIRVKDEMFKKLGQENNDSLRIAKQSKIWAFIFFFVSLGLTIYSIFK